MASPGQSTFSSFTELVSTTFRKHSKEVQDNVSKHNALWRKLYKSDKYKLIDGGLSLVKDLDYQNNSTYQRFSGFDTLNIAATDVITAAEFSWRNAVVNVAMAGDEVRKNSGSSRIIDLAQSKITNAYRSMANGLSVDVYSDGTASNQINGLQALISDAGTGTVGGINSGTYPFWQNTVQSAAAPLQGGSSITVSATTIESLMLPLYMRTTRGVDMVDIIVFSEDYFSFYEQSQTSLKRYAPDDNGQGGMISMKYKNADVFFDSSSSIPQSRGYFINTDFMELQVHRDANMATMDDLRSVNQDAKVMMLLFMGNLVVGNRALQGVMKP